jgi:positive regulator of sigma E activity
MEFLSIQDLNGVSVEHYIKKQLLPGYVSILIFLFIICVLASLLQIGLLYQAIVLVSGIIGVVWARTYNKPFLSLIWEKVLIP